jgi:hypothetical protein
MGGGSGGSLLPCNANYVHEASSWMIYGPFSLEDAQSAEVVAMSWRNVEAFYDRVAILAAIDGQNFSGVEYPGSTDGWAEISLDLAAVPWLGNLVGQPQVWVAMQFESDAGISYPEGVYLDDIVIRACPEAACRPVSEGAVGRALFEGGLPVQRTLPRPLVGTETAEGAR